MSQPGNGVSNKSIHECRLTLIPNFKGFGFNLHTQKVTNCQQIGRVDSGSPAQVGGLFLGDEILAINDVGIEGKSHQEVVSMIKSSGSSVRLLVRTTSAAVASTNVSPMPAAPLSVNNSPVAAKPEELLQKVPDVGATEYATIAPPTETTPTLPVLAATADATSPVARRGTFYEDAPPPSDPNNGSFSNNGQHAYTLPAMEQSPVPNSNSSSPNIVTTATSATTTNNNGTTANDSSSPDAGDSTSSVARMRPTSALASALPSDRQTQAQARAPSQAQVQSQSLSQAQARSLSIPHASAGPGAAALANKRSSIKGAPMSFTEKARLFQNL